MITTVIFAMRPRCTARCAIRAKFPTGNRTIMQCTMQAITVHTTHLGMRTQWRCILPKKLWIGTMMIQIFRLWTLPKVVTTKPPTTTAPPTCDGNPKCSGHGKCGGKMRTCCAKNNIGYFYYIYLYIPIIILLKSGKTIGGGSGRPFLEFYTGPVFAFL